MDQIKDDLTCQICQGYYKSPKALPCIHSFCEGCIRDYVFSRGFDSTGHFPCPLCRADTVIPQAGVASFPNNHLLQSLIETLQQNGNLTDSICSNSEGFGTATHHPAAARENSIESNHINRQNGCQAQANQVTNGCRNPATGSRPSSGSSRISTASPRGVRPTASASGVRPTASPSGVRPTAPPRSPPVLAISNMGAYASALDIPVKTNSHRAKVIFGKYGSGLAHFTQPMGLCFTNHYGQRLIHVTDQRNTRILTFKLEGQIHTIFTTEGRLLDVTSDGINTLYVAVSNAPNKEALVVSYDLHGTPISKYGNMFSFVKPDGVALNKFGHVIVTSVEEKQVYIFNKEGTLVQKFGKRGSGPDAFLSPCYVAVDSYNRIIVSDCDSHSLKVFARNGQSKLVIGRKGKRPGELNKPLGVAIDHDNNIIVADSGNQRIQLFDANGKFQEVLISDLDKQGFPSGCSIHPHAVAVCPGWLAVLFKGREFAEVRVYEYYSLSNTVGRNPLSSVCACQ